MVQAQVMPVVMATAPVVSSSATAGKDLCQSLALPSGQDASQNLKISHLFNFAFSFFLFPFSSGSFVNPPVPGTECGSEVVPFTASAYFPAAEEPPPPPPGMYIRDLLVFECTGL